MMSAPPLLTRPSVIPDSSKQLSDGVVVQASVLARLLGVKLLTVDATVLVSPAQLTGDEIQQDAGPVTAPRPQPEVHGLVLGAGSAGTPSPARSPNGLVGSRLGLAARLLEDSTGDLRKLDGP
jgi:hypothetical protein